MDVNMVVSIRAHGGRRSHDPPRSCHVRSRHRLRASRRQPNSCEGDSPASRAMADTFAPGSSDAATSRAFASDDQRRRGRCGLASKRLGTASRTWKLLSSVIGADIEIDTVSSWLPMSQSLAHHLTSRQMGSASRLRWTSSASGLIKPQCAIPASSRMIASACPRLELWRRTTRHPLR
jgi:hypothetical protein